MAINLDPITAAEQAWGTYWLRIYHQFNESDLFGDYENVVMKHNESVMSHRWGVIQPWLTSSTASPHLKRDRRVKKTMVNHVSSCLLI
jgi:hypothetical protein